MRVIVCGGRDYSDASTLWGKLDELRRRHDHLIVFQGGAHGADQMAREWCMARQVSFVSVEAEWNQHGRAAGPMRNQKMLDLYSPGLVLAFPGGRGTADMMRRAEAAGVEVIKVLAQ
jgi:hypothetical protein